MALGMSAADIAVSRKGIETLIKNVNTDANKAKKICSPESAEFKTLTKTIQTYWTGEDCDNFMADLQDAVKELAAASDSVYNQLSTALNNYYDEFTKMQSSNYAKGTTKITR